MPTIEYKNDRISPDEDAEICPDTAVVRYWLDKDSWIEVTTTLRGIEIRSDGGRMAIEPISGNNVEVYLRSRTA
jgi:hypothetical protein